MRIALAACLLLAAFLVPPLLKAAQPGTVLRPVSLTADLRSNPLGLDTQTPRLAWTLEAAPISKGRYGLRQSAYRILVATSTSRLGRHEGDVWDSGRVSGSTYWQIPYAGAPLRAHTTYYWQVRVWDGGGSQGPWSDVARWTTGLLSPSDWSAHWIAAARDAEEPMPVTKGALPLFRHDFHVNRTVARALLFVAGLGQYELRLNGNNVTATVMDPGWTNYRRTVPYDTYDVTHLLAPGANAMGVLLGNGMYHVDDVKDRYTKFSGSMGQPKCIVQLELTYTDGSSERILSDKSWKTHPGPITFSSTYGGEDFDARAELMGWDRRGFDAESWQDALEVQGPGGRLRAEHAPPLVIAARVTPVRVTMPVAGVTVYDLGRNMSGWPEIAVRGPEGSSIRLLPGELLDAHGRVTQQSAHAFPDAPVFFKYTLRGSSVERWHPRFSYYGFRYVEVTVSPAHRGGAEPLVASLAGDFVHADVSIAGSFSTSSEIFSRVHALIDRAVLSNLVSVLTDCPTREKLGWLEQTYLNASTLLLNYSVSTLYEKMTLDMQDAQQTSGLVPSIAPEYVSFVDDRGRDTDFRDSPEWGSAIILSPWALYQLTGDTVPLFQAYDAMRLYTAYLKGRSKDGLLAYGLGDWYDIGPAAPGVSQLTSKAVTATATYYQDLAVLAKIAALLGREGEKSGYLEEAAQVRASFNAAFFHAETESYDRGSQTAQAMPLALGMVPEGHAPAVLAHLVEDIRNHQDHVTAGDIGFHYVVRALTDEGRSDILAAMLSRTDSPSYGYQLSRGATTLTEAWDTNPQDSQNHFMLGHGEEWFYRGLAGIRIDMARTDGPAITLRPALVNEVQMVAAEYHSAMGLVRSAWRRSSDGGVTYKITVPIGAEAEVQLPAVAASGTAAQRAGVHSTRVIGEAQVMRIGSGNYRFTIPPARLKWPIAQAPQGRPPAGLPPQPNDNEQCCGYHRSASQR